MREKEWNDYRDQPLKYVGVRSEPEGKKKTRGQHSLPLEVRYINDDHLGESISI